MQRIVKASEPVDVDEDDLITLEEAARLRSIPMSAIGNLLDRGRLPWYQRQAINEVVEGERVQRFTSREAVMKLARKGKRTK